MDAAELREKLDGRRVIASVSGGKDSAAMCLHLEELGIDHDRVFCDTGWEAQATYDYLHGELTRKLGHITVIKAPRSLPQLAEHKGMFPQRMKRWCTDMLKVRPMRRYLDQLMLAGEDPVNTVGIRHEESLARSAMPEWEWNDVFDCEVWRPLVRWTSEDVIAIHRRHGLRPNPLYLLGAERVGCWPCIYARKSEIRLIADLDPGRIDSIRELEERVTAVARERFASRGEELLHPRTFFREKQSGKEWTIDDAVRWARQRFDPGIKEYVDVEPFELPAHARGCMRWGLCEDARPGGL